MTYEEIIQHAGNIMEPKVYYYVYGELTTIGKDDILLMRPHFETNIIGTLMRGMEVELTVQLPTNTKIYCENKATFDTYSATKEFGYFYVKSETYNADTKTYTYDMYDEMLKLMVDYKGLGASAYELVQDSTFTPNKVYYQLIDGEFVEYTGDRTGDPRDLSLYQSAFPMYVREFFIKFLGGLNYAAMSIVNYLPNGFRLMYSDVYEGIGFTNRDVLDDLGVANGVLFEINTNKEVKIRNKGTTAKIVDDDILMNQNISMAEHYGPINTIVLSRASGTDNVYYPDPLPTNPIEFKIEDNQLMNGNDRANYLPALYNQLNGLEYDIYDCQLIGYGGFDALDKVQINTIENGTTKTYNSYVFNNDIKITQGYEESIYNELPKKASTDFEYASASDKAAREATIIVNKKIAEIDIKGKTINLTADNIKIESDNFGVDENGNIRANGGTIGGYEIGLDEDSVRYLKAETYPKYNYTQADYDELVQLTLSGDTPTQEQLDKYDFNNNGTLTVTDLYYLTMLLDNGVNLSHPVYIKLSSNPGKIFESALEFIVGDIVRFRANYNGVTINDGAVLGANLLFENASGDNGDIILDDDPTEYRYIEFFGTDHNGIKSLYYKLTDPTDGDEFDLSLIEAGTTNTFIKRARYKINGSTIEVSRAGMSRIMANSADTTLGTNDIYITKVVGYR